MRCRSCDGPVSQILDLGHQRLADFRDEQPDSFDAVPLVTFSFPLVVMFCHDCGLAQLSETVPRDLMYHERYGFKSGVNEEIRKDHQSTVSSTLRKTTPRSWL